MAVPAATAVATSASGRRQRGIPPDSNGDPLKIALLSDVHGNLPALAAVLDDVDAAGPDRIWCLGDLVGYGAQPDGCVETARERCDVNLAGNHDLGVLDHIDIADFAPHAEQAARWTRENAAPETLQLPGDARARARTARRSACSTPRRATRSGNTCCPAAQAADCMDVMEPARGRHRPHARGLLLQPHRRRHGRRPRGRRDRAEHRRRGVAAEPRQRRPAARWRPTGGVAPARRGAVDRDLAPDGVPGG